jgi:hypothetical protein
MTDLESIPAEDLRDAWVNLAAHGTPPAAEIAGRVLPAWSVGLDAWLDRLANIYLCDYCRRNSHFKLAVAPYGGGKTHFLLSVGARAATENWAVSYLQCKANVSLGDWFGLYEHVAKALQLPNTPRRGVRVVAQAALVQMRERAANAPDAEYALDDMIAALEDEDWPHSAFARVMGALLQHLRDPRTRSVDGDAALRWLQGQPDTLTPNERQSLRLQPVRASERGEHGRTLLFSLVKFLPRAGVHGLALLLDEMDTILSARGTALERILTSMRIMLDAPDARMERIPLFGLFAAVPDIAEQIRKYQALDTRFQVIVPFHRGDDNAPQLDLGELGNQQEMLRAIGVKLLALGIQVHNWSFDLDLQRRNLTKLAEVTANRILEVNARRLFVKAFCGLLDEQSRSGQREFPESELSSLIQGVYEGLRRSEEAATDTDIG